MKMKVFYSMIGVAFLIGISTWQFLPKQVQTSSEIAEADSLDQVNEPDNQEETIIHLSSDQLTEFGIQTKNAGPGEISVVISTRGKIVLHPDKLAHILPKISGVAKEALKNIGDPVKEGDVLAKLESREMAEIKANYLSAQEKERLARSLLEREKQLYDKKVSAQQDYIHANSTYEEAKINLQLAKHKLHAFGIDDEMIKGFANEQDPDLMIFDIRSPMDGFVIARHINKGEFIENTTTIYEIADFRSVWIEIGIYPKDLVKVKQGQLVDVSLSCDGSAAEAKIIYLSPIIQDETITAKAVAELKNPSGNWRPGSFVKVNIATENHVVPLAIPKAAIQDIEGKDFVFVKVPEGFERRQVQVGVSDNENVEILSGLNTGEEYAASQTFLLKADLGKNEVGDED